MLTVLDEALDVSLREPSKQVRHVPTAKELADAKQYSWMRPAPYDLVRSATLVLHIENVWGIRHAWKDGKAKRLEEVLNDVVVGLIEAALQKKAQREKQERERLRQEELERQRIYFKEKEYVFQSLQAGAVRYGSSPSVMKALERFAAATSRCRRARSAVRKDRAWTHRHRRD